MRFKKVNSKGNQSWVLIGRTDAEVPTLWPHNVINWHVGKDPDSRKDWRPDKKGMTGWDGWMASPTPWTWVWANLGSWSWPGRSGVLQSMRSKRDTTEWITKLIDFQIIFPHQFSSVQSLSRVRLFATPWITARQASLSITNSQSLLKLMSIELDAIQPWHSVVPFSSCLQSFPASGSFSKRQFFASGGQSIGVLASTPVLPMNI